ncbi:MAG TPA: LuxR C-terminal-related transcriptional regulator [Allosphingosinicella sp.]|jgi:DNA-binding CsgD family transcriptional regulator|nr:LuxR C-terminal-related transcriptional regulator [Allosphingosinicella sp.]
MTADRDIQNIPEREREVLRLLVRGHDAKSIARALGLSVNVVNERLRDSRRRLGVSSSREAARLLAAHEGDELFGNKEIGLGVALRRRSYAGIAGARRPSRQLTIGLAMIFIAVAALALSSNRHDAAAPTSPTAPPRVVATSPARGAAIPPGPFLLTVTFDQPMADGSYSYTRTSPETYPDCAYPPILSRNARTFTLRCTAVPGRQYEIWFNRLPYMNFRGLNGVSSEPYQLLFRTRTR